MRLLVSLLLAVSLAAPAPAQGLLEGLRTADVEAHPRCAYCGMDRREWSHTRHLVEYADGTVEGTCSLRCVVDSLGAHRDLRLVQVSAGDAGAPQEVEPLLEVHRLTYVVDPGERGTMSATRKWAYASKVAARRALTPQGRLTDFAGALEAAFGEVARAWAQELTRSRGRRRR